MPSPTAYDDIERSLTAAQGSWSATFEDCQAVLRQAATASDGDGPPRRPQLRQLVRRSALPVAILPIGEVSPWLPDGASAALVGLAAQLAATVERLPTIEALRAPLVPSWLPIADAGAWVWQIGSEDRGGLAVRLALFCPRREALAGAPWALRSLSMMATITDTVLGLERRQARLLRLHGRVRLMQTRDEAIGMELEQARRTIDSFTTLAAHELRTPLAALMLQTDSVSRLLNAECLPRQRLGHKVQAINKQVERMHRLVEDLLDVSRLEEGRLVTRLEQVDVGEVAGQVALRLGEAFARARTDLTVNIAPGLVGELDAARVDQVISNLMLNALKYGMAQPVELRVHGDGSSIVVEVVDHGLGIAADQHQHVFSRYGRAVSERDYGGLGLGLWISRQVVRALGGSIELQSALGQGSTFLLRLPCRRS